VDEAGDGGGLGPVRIPLQFVVEQFGGRYGQRDGIRARLGQSSGGQNPVDGGLLSPSDGTEVARVSSTVGGAMAVLVRACRCADARGMSGEPPRLAPNTIRRTIFDQVHNVTGSPCCGATPAGTTPWAPLNVAPCRRYSDNSTVGTEYGTARPRRSTLRASVVSWRHCSSQPSTHVTHQKIGKSRNCADLQSANPLAGGSSPAAPLPSQSCSPAQRCVSASRRRPNSRPVRPVRAGLQRRCVLPAHRPIRPP